MSRGGNLRLARGELLGLTKGLKNLGAITAGQGYYSGTLVTVVTAVLKAVSPSQGDIQWLQSFPLVWGSSKVAH